MLQKISISNKYCSFELSVHQRILKKLWFPQKYETTVFKGILHFFWKYTHFTTPPELNSWVLPFSNQFSRFSDI